MDANPGKATCKGSLSFVQSTVCVLQYLATTAIQYNSIWLNTNIRMYCRYIAIYCDIMLYVVSTHSLLHRKNDWICGNLALASYHAFSYSTTQDITFKHRAQKYSMLHKLPPVVQSTQMLHAQ